jgi:hypothetical protein
VQNRAKAVLHITKKNTHRRPCWQTWSARLDGRGI